MRAFVLWLVVSLLVWAGAERWLDSHFRGSPKVVVVALDTSFAMEPVWGGVPELLAGFDGAPYAKYILHGPRGRLQGPSDRIDLGQLRPYGPRSFDHLAGISVEGARRVLITNAPGSELSGLAGWEIVSP
ncbi:MAG: hypothetical protein AAF479_11005 [Pseudomonadota bacterium]